jgi:hypothetical protein
MNTALTRRGLLGGAAAGAVMTAMPGALAEQKKLVFEVLRGGQTIGSHMLSFAHRGDDLIVDISINLVVEVAWVPVFRYEHHNHEVWRDGRLIGLESRTNDDGRKFAVSARKLGDHILIEGNEGTIEAPADLLTTSYWHPKTPDRDRLLDTQEGAIVRVHHAPRGTETLNVAGRTIDARRYDATGDLDLTVWYSLDHVWCGLQFDARGEEVHYRAVDVPDSATRVSFAQLAEI